MARPTSRRKSKLSKAVCELRTRLGWSQQTLSNRLGVALNTIARYETAREPSGEALLKLGDLASVSHHWDLSELFHTRYLDDVLKNFHRTVISLPATDGEPSHGYLVMRLRGDDEVRYGHVLRSLLSLSGTDRPDLSKKARDMILQANKWLVEEVGMSDKFGKEPEQSEEREQ
jgi:transcriptional regulator with XRE-family HTH domain